MGRPNDLKSFFLITYLEGKNQSILQQESVNTTGAMNIRQQGKDRIGQILSSVYIFT